MMDDIGLDDDNLITIETKVLNSLLKKRKIDKNRQREVKIRRRTLKNRGYAANCRHKRDETEETLTEGNKILDKKIQQETDELEEFIRTNKMNRQKFLNIGFRYNWINRQSPIFS